MNIKKVAIVGLFYLKTNTKKASFWASVLWPVTVLMLFGISSDENQLSRDMRMFNLNDTLKFYALLVFVLITIQLVGPIVLRTVMPDRASKVHNYLRTLVKPDIELKGYLLGSIGQVGILFLVYLALILLMLNVTYLPGEMISVVVNNVSIFQFIVVVLVCFQLFLWGVLVSIHLGLHTVNKTYLSTVQFLPVLIIILTTIVESEFVVVNGSWTYLLRFLPIMGQINLLQGYLTSMDASGVAIIILMFHFGLLGIYFVILIRKYTQTSIEA